AADNIHLRLRGTRPEGHHELPTGMNRAGITPEVERELQRIATLGYVAGSERAHEVSGVLRYDQEAAFAGFTLYTCAERPEAFLIDMRGNVIHSWTSPGSVYSARAHVFPNGDLLVVAANPPHMIRLTSESEVVWRYDGDVHHDFAVMPDGSTYVLVQEAVSWPGIRDGAPLLDDHIVLLDPNGRELERVSLLDAFERSEERSGWLADHPLPDDGDIFHTNSIEVFSRGEQTRVLLSVRHIHTIAILDMDTREIVFAMDGPWRKQHEAQLVGGNLLLFDNLGLTEALGNDGQSRVLEIDPRTRELVWSYTEPGFFTHTGGAQQRLPNGNTLITETIKGRIFEVTKDGRIVWEYVNQLRVESEPDLVLAILRSERIPADFVSEWAAGYEVRGN
ncbi:MAG: aryl-sulfate sulfotransferase, partial [Armatimonadetes bacterium]|nr:aryl-sulfate sulfotransferase [Armatimonadota bacterium]